MVAHWRFEAVNLISDPIHRYIELTKRLSPAQAARAGLPVEDAAEEDLLDTPWVQRLRRISQLQSARWVFPTAEHSRFTHGLGVMHEAGLWGRSLYPTLRETLQADSTVDASGRPEPIPSEALVVETLRVAGLLHDVGHGPFAHFFDDHFLHRWPAPAHPSRDPGKRLTHEDLGQAIVERELAASIAALRRAPGVEPSHAAFASGESVDPRWISFLISKPPIADPAMPLWVRRLQPLFSGVFTVDNLDYVRRDAYLTGVSSGLVDADRLRRYSFISERGLTLYEPALSTLEMFLTARLLMYDPIYFHRTVRAIDLDLAEVFGPSIVAIFGDRDPLEALDAYLGLDEYGLLHQAARWARGESLAEDATAGSGQVSPRIGELWRGILLRRPSWRAVKEVRRAIGGDVSKGLASGRSVEDELRAGLSTAAATADDPGGGDGRFRVDLALADGRPQNPLHAEGMLVVARRDGTLDTAGLRQLLERVPAVVVVGRAYERAA